MEDSEDEGDVEPQDKVAPAARPMTASVAVQTMEAPAGRGVAARDQLLAAAKQEILKLRVRHGTAFPTCQLREGKGRGGRYAQQLVC